MGGVANLSERMVDALAQLQGMITKQYATTTFVVSRAEDDPEAVHLDAIVDVDDPDEVVDLVIDRMLELQLEEGLPVYVIPLRTPEREAALLHRLKQQRPGTLPSSLFP